MRGQQQFLAVIDRDAAERRFRAALGTNTRVQEVVPLDQALGRVLAEDVGATTDVPAFDRSNGDGYAVQAADTFESSEQATRRVRRLHPGVSWRLARPPETCRDSSR